MYCLKVILETISCGHKIHLEKFADDIETRVQLYVRLYRMDPMSHTIQKILPELLVNVKITQNYFYIYGNIFVVQVIISLANCQKNKPNHAK